MAKNSWVKDAAIKALGCENVIQLQSVGWVKAIPLGDIKPGMFMLYNFGSKAEIISVERKGNQMHFVVRSDHDGNDYPQTRRATTLVACYTPEELKGLKAYSGR